ncbi:hypothetical protein [Alkalilimnicola ehrlichii]|nr:hypothetical protein [Alkalilimnicola ehrlichii]
MQVDFDQYGVLCWQVMLESADGEQPEMQAVCSTYLQAPNSEQDKAAAAG